MKGIQKYKLPYIKEVKSQQDVMYDMVTIISNSTIHLKADKKGS